MIIWNPRGAHLLAGWACRSSSQHFFRENSEEADDVAECRSLNLVTEAGCRCCLTTWLSAANNIRYR
jgi:hypothetical protein